MSFAEICACLTYAASVWLAARNNTHTWWIGIVGSLLYGYVFFTAKLYADVTLQAFFIVTSLSGWVYWLKGRHGAPAPIRRSSAKEIGLFLSAATVIAGAYGFLLHSMTDAYAPFIDSFILTFSVLGQFLLVNRRIENWMAWLVVNTIAAPLYASRDLYLSSGLYCIFWANAWYGLYRWRKEWRNATG